MRLDLVLDNILCALALVSGTDAAAVCPRASKGCGQSHTFVGESREFTFESDGINRTYRIHLPKSYDKDHSQPLFLFYHGKGGQPKDIEYGTQLSTEEVNPNMVAVYPAGVNKSWQGPTYAKPGINDLKFTDDLVNRIKSDYCIDESRIYAGGHSNGGGFVGLLACSKEGGHFAAFAPSAAALYTDVNDQSCTPARSPLPIMETHGTADKTIPYEGGKGAGGPLPAIPDWLSRWAKRNKCDEPKTSDKGKGVTLQQWKCGGKENALRHWKLKDQGHDYPGRNNEHMWLSPKIIEFFNAHKKP
ncbi:hypothetical protein V2G26_017230 [Clonostachys chloroleuca]|uniref:feruloyl esterase n=1 Tax=Clonostachys chloroleuca TaxID=1926264 RepID=A0AA35MCF1_9HYPO|nr:unnamed protein product [Clonostachys chloroleuca]